MLDQKHLFLCVSTVSCYLVYIRSVFDGRLKTLLVGSKIVPLPLTSEILATSSGTDPEVRTNGRISGSMIDRELEYVDGILNYTLYLGQPSLLFSCLRFCVRFSRDVSPCWVVHSWITSNPSRRSHPLLPSIQDTFLNSFSPKLCISKLWRKYCRSVTF